MNIWHDISPKRITPDDFYAVIEISKGDKNKYELDKETGLLKMDRIGDLAGDALQIQLGHRLHRRQGGNADLLLRHAADGNANAQQAVGVNAVGGNKAVNGLRQEVRILLIIGQRVGNALAADQLRTDVDAGQMDALMTQIDADGESGIAGHADGPGLAAAGGVEGALELQQFSLLQFLQILPDSGQAQGQGLSDVLLGDRSAGRVNITEDTISILTPKLSSIVSSSHIHTPHQKTFGKVIHAEFYFIMPFGKFKSFFKISTHFLEFYHFSKKTRRKRE